MADPLVSIVIPAYRSGELIKEAIQSVFNQSYENYELIIVDNNANEETKEVIQEMIAESNKKIRLVYESVQGNSSARNKGILEAKGSYIAFLDDDDMMHPWRIESQLSIALLHPEASIIYGGLDVCSYNGKEIHEQNLVPNVEFFVKPIMKSHPRFKADPPLLILPSVMFFQKEKAIKAGLFDTKFNPCHTEDTDFSFRMWHSGPFFGVRKSVSIYRRATASFFEKKRQGILDWYQTRKNQDLFFQKLVSQYFNKNDSKNIKNFQLSQSQLLRETSHNILRYSDGRAFARRLLLRAIYADKLDLKNCKWFLRTYYSDGRLKNSLNIKSFANGKLKDDVNIEELEKLFLLP